MKSPRNLRVEENPYPHLRDDHGCVLASDYIHSEKMAFILAAVREKIEHEARMDRVAPKAESAAS